MKVQFEHGVLAEIAKGVLDAKLVRATELKDGWFNSAYKLEFTDRPPAVIKVAPADHLPVMSYEKGIMRSEVEAMQLVKAKTGAPVPQILAYDTTRKWIDHDFYIMDFVLGDVYDKVASSMGPDALRRTEREVGHYLREINEIRGESFGVFAGPRFATWREAYTWMFEAQLLDGRACDTEAPIAAIEEKVRRRLPLMEEVREARLVHWDLWAGNTFLNPATGEVTGLVDFERSLYGDPLMEVNWMSSNLDFVQGYGADLLAGPEAKTRRLVYDLYLYSMAWIESSYRHYATPEVENWGRQGVAKTLRLL